MRPGVTMWPLASRTIAPAAGRRSVPTPTTRPSEKATSAIRSIPWLGSMTRPPLRTRSVIQKGPSGRKNCRNRSSAALRPEEGTDALFDELDAEPRPVRNGELAAFDLQLRRAIDHREMLRDAIGVDFLNEEIGHRGIELQRRRRRHRRGAEMRRHAHVVG